MNATIMVEQVINPDDYRVVFDLRTLKAGDVIAYTIGKVMHLGTVKGLEDTRAGLAVTLSDGNARPGLSMVKGVKR